MRLQFSDGYRHLLRVVWTFGIVLVVIGSLLPESSAPIRLLGLLHLSDKLIHFLAYAGLAFLPGLHERRSAAVFIGMALVSLGVALEFAQSAVGRAFEIMDMVSNAGGVFCGLFAAATLRP